MLQKIISGAQTGVDRGALDAALEAKFPCGGCCPAGRKAEDGPIPERYPVVELARAGYLARTRQNVLDADATLVIGFGELSGGTLETVRFAERFGKPLLVVDAFSETARDAAVQAASFCRESKVKVLNVAGPRESSWPGACAFARELVRLLLQANA